MQKKLQRTQVTAPMALKTEFEVEQGIRCGCVLESPRHSFKVVDDAGQVIDGDCVVVVRYATAESLQPEFGL